MVGKDVLALNKKLARTDSKGKMSHIEVKWSELVA